jgi:hypothetical protein
MKLRNILLIVSGLFNCVVSAQNEQTNVPQPNTTAISTELGPTSYLGITIGPGIPLGKYKDSAFASTGLDFTINIAYTVTHTNTAGYGIAFKLDDGHNPMNAKAFESAFNKQLYLQTHDPHYTSILQNPGNLSYYGAYVGFYSTISIKKFAIDMRVMGGILFGDIPEMQVGVFDSGTQIGAASASETSGYGASLCAGAGLRYLPSHTLSFILNIDFVYADPSISTNSATITQSSSGPVITQNTTNQAFKLITIGLGIAWIPEHKDLSKK